MEMTSYNTTCSSSPSRTRLDNEMAVVEKSISNREIYDIRLFIHKNKTLTVHKLSSWKVDASTLNNTGYDVENFAGKLFDLSLTHSIGEIETHRITPPARISYGMSRWKAKMAVISLYESKGGTTNLDSETIGRILAMAKRVSNTFGKRQVQ